MTILHVILVIDALATPLSYMWGWHAHKRSCRRSDKYTITSFVPFTTKDIGTTIRITPQTPTPRQELAARMRLQRQARANNRTKP